MAVLISCSFIFTSCVIYKPLHMPLPLHLQFLSEFLDLYSSCSAYLRPTFFPVKFVFCVCLWQGNKDERRKEGNLHNPTLNTIIHPYSGSGSEKIHLQQYKTTLFPIEGKERRGKEREKGYWLLVYTIQSGYDRSTHIIPHLAFLILKLGIY